MLLLILNQDLILQTPKMNLPFGVTIFNEQHYLKLSFLNSENDPQMCIFHDLILKIGTYFKNYISSNKKNSGYQFTNPISKYKSYHKGKEVPTQVVYFDEVRAGKTKEKVIVNLKWRN